MGQQGEVADGDCRQPSSPANKSPIFYRMIVPSIIQDEKLRIPGKFVKKLGDELPTVATLTTPNGCVWQVGLKKIEDKVWFTDGWNEFMKHQSINAGYLLVFTYLGNSNFTVNIYDLGTSEIKYQCNTLRSFEGPNYANRCPVTYKEKAEEDDSVEILHSCPPSQAQEKLRIDPPSLQKPSLVPYVKHTGCYFRGSELKSNPPYKAGGGKFHPVIIQSASQSTRDIGIQCGCTENLSSACEISLHSLSQRHETPKKRKRRAGPSETKLSSKHGSKVQTPGTERSRLTFMRRWGVVTPEEKERVLNESKLFQSENPFCRIVLRRSYVYKGIGLHMPSSFAEKYLSKIAGSITLEIPDGTKWLVRCVWRDGSTKLSKGWPEFVWDNRLEEGDVCVFELIATQEVVLKVTIFRVAEDAQPVNQIPKELPGRTGQLTPAYDLNG